MSKQWDRWSFLALFFPSVIILGIHAYIGSFNRFIADDFCSVYFAERLGAVRSMWYWYLNWFGAFSASLTDGLMPAMGIRGLTFSVVVTLLIWLTLAIWAVWLLLPKNLNTKTKLLAAFSLGTAILYVFMLVNPDVPQSFYWWNGMRRYILPLIFSTLFLIVFQLFVRKVRSTSQKILWGGFGFLTSFFGCGFNETFTPVHIVLIAALIFLGLISRKIKPGGPAFLILAAGLLGSVSALFVVVAAPGNAVRQAFFPAAPGLLTILSISVKGYWGFLGQMFGAVDKVSGLIALGCASAWLAFRMDERPSAKAWMAPAFLLAGLTLAFGCFPPSAYGMSDVPPERSLASAAFYITVSVACAGYVFGAWLAPKVGTAHAYRANLGFGIGLTVLMLFSSLSSGLALTSSIQEYRDYAVNSDRMSAQILRAKAAGQSEVTIPFITNWANLDNPGENPKFWVNVCVSKYYDIDVLALPADQ